MVERLAEAHRLEQHLRLVVGRVVDDLEDADLVPALAEARRATSGRTSLAKPGSMPEVKNDVPPARHAVLELVAHLREERLRVHERHDRARHDVLARGEDAADVLDRLEGPQVGGRGVADAVGVEREERVGVVGRAHAGRGGSPQSSPASVPGLRRAVHPHADELELGMVDDAPQREARRRCRCSTGSRAAPCESPQSNGQFVDSVPPSTSTTLPVTQPPAGEHEPERGDRDVLDGADAPHRRQRLHLRRGSRRSGTAAAPTSRPRRPRAR